MTAYEIHDNHDRPFRVTVDDRIKNLRIWERDEHYSEDFANKSSIEVDYRRVFIGESPLIKMTKYSNGDEFSGNTILVELHSPNTYLFIGGEIFTFQTFAEIVEFVSPVGNNNVPYPYAIDTDNKVYLLAEKVVIDSWSRSEQYDDPYSYYYRADLITPTLGQEPAGLPIHPDFCNIKEYWVGDSQYMLRYKPNAPSDYDRIENWNEGDMRLIYNDGTEKTIDRDEYISLMEEFGELAGFQPFPGVQTVYDRTTRKFQYGYGYMS